MSLPTPKLDDRRYGDLLAEAQSLLPGLDPEWTDHNPSDPGITFLELFAWLAEMLIYRVDRLPQENLRTFLRLLNGPGWQPGEDLTEDVRTTVVALRQRYRAVTGEDYEALAREAATPAVARARAVPRRNLAANTEEARALPRAGHVSLIVVPDPAEEWAYDDASAPGAPLPSTALLDAVRAYLKPRRLLTVRQVVVAPIYAPVVPEIVLARRPDVPDQAVRDRAVGALETFLDPLAGGPDGEGWPFGRDVYLSELYQVLEAVPGVDFVTDVALASVCPQGARRCVEAATIWHDDGDPVGLALGAHHLPWARVAPDQVVVGQAFAPVRVAITAQPAPGALPGEVRRAILADLRLQFHPRHDGPDGTIDWQTDEDAMKTRLGLLPEVRQLLAIELDADPARLFTTPGGVRGVRVPAGELADWTATIEVAET